MTNKYVITDPCYLIDDNTWHDCCEKMRVEKKAWDDSRFNKLVTAALKKLSNDSRAVAARTGYGDWTNKINYHSNKAVVERPKFAADSGMVCVCKINDRIQKIIDKYSKSGNCELFAIFSTNEDIYYNIEENTDWSVVTAFTKSTLIVETMLKEDLIKL